MTRNKGLLIILLFLFGCTTQKNTWVTRTYHNTTSRFNILFNGRESFIATNDKIKESYKDDFTQLLPIFVFEDEEINSLVSGDMDRTLTKGSKIVTFHSITVKPERKKGFVSLKDQEFYNRKEFNKWMDDNYLLMGKAHYFKGDYMLASETFRFILSEYPEATLKQETYIWLARTYSVDGDFREAEDILIRLTNDFEMSKKLKGEFYATYADFYIKQENFSSAIPMLEKAIESEKKKKKKIRYTYILAQINLLDNNLDEASRLFEDVIKMNPPYEMTFNAQISMALAYQAGSESSDFLKEELNKMLKDDKNIDYQDQIYYALANIAFKEGEIEKAVELYQLSANKSTENVYQKALSHLAIANIFYDDKKYLDAQAYYDSAVININSDFPDYDIILAKSTSLGRLVENLRKVELQDSLQTLAALPEDTRIERIDQIIEQVKEEERRAKEREEEMRASGMYDQNQLSTNRSTSVQGKWYFYNMAAKSVGQPEFKMRWGNRKLEDNWRRRNKKQIIVEEVSSDIDASAENGGQTKVTDNKTREFYIQDLPLTDSAIEVSDNVIMESLFAVGLIYENELFDNVQAKKAYEDLTSRFPGNEYAAMAYYALYEMSRDEQNTALINSYRNKILNDYPESIYAKILLDPDYLNMLEKEETKAERNYEEAYQFYRNEDFSKTLQLSNAALEEFSGHDLEPNFAFLKAVSMGKLSNDSILREELVQFINNHPGSAPLEYAKTMVALLDNKKPELAEAKEEEIAIELYNATEDTLHFVGFVTQNLKEMNQLVFNIINYNLDNFDKLNLTTNGEDLSGNNRLITIQKFNNRKEAENYLKTLLSNEDVFKEVNKGRLIKFSISANNYLILKKDKSVTRYLKFYAK